MKTYAFALIPLFLLALAPCIATPSACAAAGVAANVSSLKLDPTPGSLSRLTSAATNQTTKRFIVTLRDGASPDDFCARRGLRMRKQTRHSPSGFARNLAGNEALVLTGLNIVICHLTDAEARTARGEKGVWAVEPDGKAAPCGQIIPSGLVRIGADHFPVAHINGTPKPLDVDVAVLDTGIDPHEDLPTIDQWASPFGNDGSDEVGHGTAVAGIIAALDNTNGVVGVAPGVRLWNIKVIGPPPDDIWSYVLQGMSYILQNADKISVVNVSLVNDGPVPYRATRIAVQRLVNAGVVVVAGIGNNAEDIAGPDGKFGLTDDGYNTDDIVPAALPETMAVSAMNPTNDTLWLDSPGVGSNISQIERTNNPDQQITNYVFSPGGAIDVAAPGVDIYTTLPFTFGTNKYGHATGTSFAAPHVTGLVALYIAANGRATNAEGVYRIRQAIVDASLPQAQWNTNNTHDPDTHPEPLALASEAWIPQPNLTSYAGAPGNFSVGFAAAPGYDYTVQSAPNLTPPIGWTNLTTISGSNFVADVSVTDTNVASQSFYQLKRSASP